MLLLNSPGVAKYGRSLLFLTQWATTPSIARGSSSLNPHFNVDKGVTFKCMPPAGRKLTAPRSKTSGFCTGSSKTKFCNKRIKMVLNSNRAKDFPMQIRGPLWKDPKAKGSLASSERLFHRSGSNSSTVGPQILAFRWRAAGAI